MIKEHKKVNGAVKKEPVSARAVGMEREKMACRYLKERGVRIKERNFRCRQGEIDLIGYDGEYLVFFEVKYRKAASKGSASEAVDSRKQKKICRVSDYYRMIHNCPSDTAIRYDVIAIDGEQVNWIRNAFYYCGMQ